MNLSVSVNRNILGGDVQINVLHKVIGNRTLGWIAELFNLSNGNIWIIYGIWEMSRVRWREEKELKFDERLTFISEVSLFNLSFQNRVSVFLKKKKKSLTWSGDLGLCCLINCFNSFYSIKSSKDKLLNSVHLESKKIMNKEKNALAKWK